ncbi:hypothetical protein EVAR_84998_1 [Eumeta japonica]|uniref:Uncharacterized protein n=1 Tax=Eumeta variegata TaxID=151549 RepID=A0A4C1W7Q9_EUMVA|nr:hypothetical protein EVAR_84998_1 [Eumeta japonica]
MSSDPYFGPKHFLVSRPLLVYDSVLDSNNDESLANGLPSAVTTIDCVKWQCACSACITRSTPLLPETSLSRRSTRARVPRQIPFDSATGSDSSSVSDARPRESGAELACAVRARLLHAFSPHRDGRPPVCCLHATAFLNGRGTVAQSERREMFFYC